MNELTVIIPFLNEGYEVERTLYEVRQTAKNAVDILMVNDGSDDGIDYESIAKRYNAAYIKNETRTGSGPAKQIGVDACKTPFFLIIDAHMRFYAGNWAQEIVDAIKTDARAVYCCRTRAWDYASGIERPSRACYGGFLIDYLSDNLRESLLTVRAIGDILAKKAFPVDAKIIDVPCMWGANYAATKEYWNYLRGYEGLKLYGQEEQYISIKAWMEGGRIRLINDVFIGHLYKKSFTYKEKIVVPEVPYNKFFVADLLLPPDFKKKVVAQIKKRHRNTYAWVLSELYKNEKQIDDLKAYYKKILLYPYERFDKINQMVIDKMNELTIKNNV